MTLDELSTTLDELSAAKRTFTLAEIRALVALPSPGTAKQVSVRELASQLGFNGPSMSRTVSGLVNCRLARKTRNPIDQRFVVLTRTAKGEQLLKKALGIGVK